MTSSMISAVNQFCKAYAAGCGVFHIVTDNFSQVCMLLEFGYFHRDPDSEYYEPGKDVYESHQSSGVYRELTENTKNGGTQPKNPFSSPIPADERNCIFYAHPMQGENGGEFSTDQIDSMLQFIERRALMKQSKIASLDIEKDEGPYSCLILYGLNLQLPSSIKSKVTQITFPPLSYDDFKEILKSKEPKLTEQHIKWYVNHVGGCNEFELKSLLEKILQSGAFMSLLETHKAEAVIIEQKKQRLSINGKLTCENTDDVAEIGGMKNVLNYLCIEKHALEKGFNSKGMLFAGLPGSGKSAMAKYTAKYLDLPLIRLEMSKVLGKYVGESEKNMSLVLQDLKETAPCVFWIDEIEKAFSGSKGENDGGGVVLRLVGMLLTFMQELKSSVFIVVTANDIKGLPPELFRNGRFDARFAAMMPDYKTCRDILSIHLGKPFNQPETLEKFLEIITHMEQPIVGEDNNVTFEPRFLTGADIKTISDQFRKLRAIRGENEDNFTIMREVNRYVVTTADSTGKGLEKIAKNYCSILNLNVMMSDGDNIPSGLGNQSHNEPLFEPSRYHPERLDWINYENPPKERPCCMDYPKRIVNSNEGIKALSNKVASEHRFTDVCKLFDSIMFQRITQEMDRLLVKEYGFWKEYIRTWWSRHE